jgi:hypothetical protein
MQDSDERVGLIVRRNDSLGPAIGTASAIQVVEAQDAMVDSVDRAILAGDLFPPARGAILRGRGDMSRCRDAAERDDYRCTDRSGDLEWRKCGLSPAVGCCLPRLQLRHCSFSTR